MGDIVLPMRQHGLEPVICADIHNWGYPGTVVRDFFETDETFDSIITNPPHDRPLDFVWQAKRLANKAAMLLPLDVEAAVGFEDLRADAEYPLKAVYTFTQSIPWIGVPRAGKIKYGWFVFQRGFQGDVVRDWITYDENRQEKKINGHQIKLVDPLQFGNGNGQGIWEEI
jgi:hypothetical protein